MPKAKLTDINKRRKAKEDAFIADFQTSKHSNAQTSSHLEVQKSTRKPITSYIPPDLHKQLKIAAVAEEREMSELVEQALREYLSKA